MKTAQINNKVILSITLSQVFQLLSHDVQSVFAFHYKLVSESLFVIRARHSGYGCAEVFFYRPYRYTAANFIAQNAPSYAVEWMSQPNNNSRAGISR